MVGAAGEVQARDPGEAGEDKDKEEEEDTGDFKPEDAAHAAERLKKAAQAAAEAARSLAGHIAGGAGCGLRGGLAGGGLGSGGNALAGDTPGYAQSDAQSAADLLRLHSVYDGSSGACRAALPFVCRLPFAARRRWK